jgi:hypothetical protein
LFDAYALLLFVLTLLLVMLLAPDWDWKPPPTGSLLPMRKSKPESLLGATATCEEKLGKDEKLPPVLAAPLLLLL